MSIAKVWNRGQVIWQEAEEEVPNAAILAHIDSAGTIVLQQEENQIVIDRQSVEMLVKVLRMLAKQS